MAPARRPAHPYGHAGPWYLEKRWITGLPRTHLRPPAAAVPGRPGASQAGGTPKLPGTPAGSTTREGFPLWHIQQPPATVAPRRSPGSPHASGVPDGTPEQPQETRNPGRSRHRSRTPPPAALRVVFHEDMDRDHGGPCDPHARQPSSTADPRHRSKRPRTKRTHIPTILTPVERERQAALHADPHQAAGEASSSSAASLPSQRPTHCREDHTPRTRDQGSLRPTQALHKERGGSPPRSPEAPKPPRAHRGNRGTTPAAQGRTQK